MPNLKYEFNRLRTDYYLGRVSERYGAGRRVPPPSYVLWDATRRCNLACVHCGATKETYSVELTTEQITAVVDQLATLKVGMFAVTGGEPLLRSDLLEVLAHAHAAGLKTGIATNGFLIDPRMAGRIRVAGVYSVQVSLDGPEAVHNRIRSNRQSFARAVGAVELLREQRIPLVSVATTVTPDNLADLAELRQILLRLGVRLWRLAPVMPIGRAQDSGLALNGVQLEALFRFVEQNDGRGPHIYIGENLTFLGTWERRIRNGPAICPVGFTACCIGVDGGVRGCPEQPDTPVNREGSVLDSPFAHIWQTGFQRYRTREVLTADPDCAACKSKLECLGGCWVMREERRHCILRLLASSGIRSQNSL
jgi:radical SAM protein with 4Fe4S-binding SPASM domain